MSDQTLLLVHVMSYHLFYLSFVLPRLLPALKKDM